MLQSCGRSEHYFQSYFTYAFEIYLMKNRNQCEDGLVGVSATQMTYFQPYRPGESNGDWQRRTGEEGVGTSTQAKVQGRGFQPEWCI